jgi:UDPglucose--hexose-1-phosphate uridylyltransferase
MEFAVEERAPASSACPFCEGNESETPPEIWADRAPGKAPDGPGWRVRVVPNKFPALELGAASILTDAGEGMRQGGVGAHEVFIEGARHAERLTDLAPETTLALLTAIRARLRAHSLDRRLVHASVFKNVGPRAGASLSHGHSQLLAMPVVPPAVRQELDGAARAFANVGGCAYCEIARRERAGGARLVLATELHAAVAPFAPRFPFETWILPSRHVSAFEDANEAELEDLTRVLLTVLARVDGALGRPPFNLVLHGAPFRAGYLDSFHWHFEIYPRTVLTAGFEFGSGAFINAVLPETAARCLARGERFAL